MSAGGDGSFMADMSAGGDGSFMADMFAGARWFLILKAINDVKIYFYGGKKKI